MEPAAACVSISAECSPAWSDPVKRTSGARSRSAESVAPAILWIDEIDKALAGSAGAGRSDARHVGAGLRHAADLAVRERLAEVFVICTANDISQLPPELLRKGRLDEIFFVDLPNPRNERVGDPSDSPAKRKRRDPARSIWTP